MNYWIIGTLVLSIISPISYTKSMLAGKAKPHRTTRLIVLLASIASVLGVVHSSNVAGQIFAGIFLARASYLFIMSMIYGTGGWAALDKYCFVIGVLALLAYVTTHNGVLTISLGILSDVIGFVPTFVKTYRHPESEDPVFFGIEGVASFLGVLAIWELRPDIIFPLYFTVCSAGVLLFIYRKKLLKLLSRDQPHSNETMPL